MIHYYLQKGFSPNELLNLSFSERCFYEASMELALKDKDNYLKKIFG